MHFLVQLRLTNSARPTVPADGVAFIEQFIFPTLELCKQLQKERKIVGGGAVSSGVALAFIVNAESAQELDDLITGLPLWPRMDTDVTPLTTFDARMESLVSLREALKAQMRRTTTSPPEGGR